MADYRSLMIGLAGCLFLAAFLVLGVLLVVRPEWTVRQRWSPVNVERLQQSTDLVDFKSLTPGYYRRMGVLLVVFIALFVARLAGWAVGEILGWSRACPQTDGECGADVCWPHLF
jgi:hypothetical protein